MKRLAGILALLTLLAACGQSTEEQPPEDPDNYKALIAATPVAQVEGETVSPDGRFEVRAEGASGLYVSGVQPPEYLRIVDRETGEVLWQERGWLWQSALWRGDSGMVALAWSARTWNAITVIETENWTSWDFTLPDGSPIPEYTFLPYDEPWGVWRSANSLDVTVGRGGDTGEKRFYRCIFKMEDGQVTGDTREVSREILLDTCDFDHDGATETVELTTIWYPESTGEDVEWYEIRVLDGENWVLWEDSADYSHAGGKSLYALTLDDRDYLLQYSPYMGQGYCTYQYQIFSLDRAREPVVYREDSVEFDINFGSPIHSSFDIPAIAAFLKDVHGYLDNARELINTHWGEIIDLGDVGYSDIAAMEKALKDFQRNMMETDE